ncbi:MAG: hypothetical protein U5L11_04715 [Arhodomonas sp.]|nr:hypothetical protein [Arhodomonas sp.]
MAEGLGAIRDRHGGDALCGFGSAKGSNEEAYLVQKLVRAAFGTNNVDHCTRAAPCLRASPPSSRGSARGR